jgi:NTE family protein
VLKTAFALSSGGAIALSNIGMLKAFEEGGIKPDIITGTSMGAIIGAMYAYYGSCEKLESLVRDVLKKDIFKKLGFTNYGNESSAEEPTVHAVIDKFKKWMAYNYAVNASFLISYHNYIKVIDSFVPDIHIEDLSIPFACVTTELTKGERVLLTKGSLRKALYMSSAIQGIIEPFYKNKKIYVDGGPVENVPVQAAKEMGADYVVGCYNSRLPFLKKEHFKVMDAILRSSQASSAKLAALYLSQADITVEPYFYKGNWWNFTLMPYYIKSGYESAKTAVKAVRKSRQYKRFFSFMIRLGRS